MVILSLSSRSIAEKIERQLSHRSAACSVNAIASMLAHEVKNPLSGIKGAAQLLEGQASTDDQKLTNLIQNEVDRICELIDGMCAFAGNTRFSHESVNIHQISTMYYKFQSLALVAVPASLCNLILHCHL